MILLDPITPAKPFEEQDSLPKVCAISPSGSHRCRLRMPVQINKYLSKFIMKQKRIVAKRAVWGVLSVLALLIGILSWNYWRFSSRQGKPSAIARPNLDSKPLYQRLQRAIQIPTDSTAMSRISSDSKLHRFRDYIRESFPTLHESPFVFRTGKDFGDDLNPSMLLEWPGQNPDLGAILLMSHFDVVPVEASSLSKWSRPPFSGHIDDEFIWGRGTLDCKHGVMAILEAISLLSVQGFRPQRTIYVALGHDEEIGGADGNQKIAAWFRSQGRRLHTIIDEGGCIFTEFPGLGRPAALVGVAEKGFLTVNLTVMLDADKVGHASMPPRETAVSILSRAIHRVQSSPFPTRIEGGLRDTLNFLGPEMPSLASRLAMSNMWLFAPLVKRTLSDKPSGDALLRTTLAPTMIEGGVSENVLPLQATAKLNLRILPGDSIESALAHIRSSINDPRVTIQPQPNGKEASPVTRVDSDAFAILQKTIHQVFPDVVVAPFVLVGSTDTTHYTDLCENIFRFIPTRLSERDTQRFHGIDERISRENYLEIIQFFHQFIKSTSVN
jgi:carboxypeptidase PM20D1